MSQTTTTTSTTKTISVATDEKEIYTIDELIRRRAVELQGSPLLGYPKEGLIDYEEHSAEAINKYADAAAAVLLERGLKVVVRKQV